MKTTDKKFKITLTNNDVHDLKAALDRFDFTKLNIKRFGDKTIAEFLSFVGYQIETWLENTGN